MKKEYLSYSRAFIFSQSKYEFIKTYIFRERREEKVSSKFKLLHEIIQKYFKDRKEYYNYMTICADKELKHILDSFIVFINLDYNKDIKKVFECKVFEKELTDDKNKILGRIDALSGDSILEIKGESDKSISKKRFRYALQQVIYCNLFNQFTGGVNPKYYLLSIPMTYPYEISRFSFSYLWIEEVDRIFKTRILPQYNEYVLKLKSVLGEDCFLKKHSDKNKILNWLVNENLLTIDHQIKDNDWDYRDLQLNIIGNKNRVAIQ